MIFIARQSADQQVETRTLQFRKIEMQSFVLIPKTARSKSQGRDYTESGSDKDVKMQSEEKWTRGGGRHSLGVPLWQVLLRR